jgi:putative heme-binding domain-containing protein/fibro-slime domain-containing protein
VRGALDDPQPNIRQAAARSAGLHRDARALERLAQLVTTDQPPVRREAATSLGRIGNRQAVPALLDGLNSATGDRFLEHALIFALIKIGDRAGTLRGLEAAGSEVKRGALVALDQMDDGRLVPGAVTPFLAPVDPLLQQTALWVIAHHADWGQSMLGFFGDWLARQDMDDAQRDALRHQLLAFSGDAGVQELMATTLSDSQTPPATRLLLLEVIGQSQLAKLPAAWAAALTRAMADSDERIVRQCVATLRALPLDKRPLESQFVERVDVAETAGRFPPTRLSDNFCVRYSGVIRCPTQGAYTFYTNSDDGSWLYLDGKLVVDNGGSHAMREREGRVDLAAGDHELRLDFVEEEGEAGCILSWAFDGRDKEVVPAGALFHRPKTGARAHAGLEAGVLAEFYELGGATETFPDVAASELDEPLVRVALDADRPIDVRVQAAAAVTGRLPVLEPALYEFLRASLNDSNPPLVRLDAAEALGAARLDDAQLAALCDTLAQCTALETPRLLRAFEKSRDEEVGRQLVAALARSPGLKSLPAEALTATLSYYPETIQREAEPLVKQLTLDTEKQQARLAELSGVLAGGEIQRGRDLFYGNQKAICATCHAVQGQGGRIGPDLSKIGAIRAPRDLLEAIVLPSASFARGYEPFTVLTTDGQVQSGVIVRETADAVYLFNNARVEVRVPRTSIETLQQSTVSIMPQGMDEQLSRQDLADLIAFLQSLR